MSAAQASGTTAPRTGSQSMVAGPHTGAHAVVADAVDPARRPDVLLRVRRDDDHQINAWWLVGAFVAVSGAVIALLSFIPGGV